VRLRAAGRMRLGYRDEVAVLRVPFHLDEYLPDLDTPLGAGQEIAPVLPAGDVWDRLGVLYAAVGQAVAGARASAAAGQ